MTRQNGGRPRLVPFEHPALTDREVAIVRMVNSNWSNDMIEDVFGWAEGSAKVHISRLRLKFINKNIPVHLRRASEEEGRRRKPYPRG